MADDIRRDFDEFNSRVQKEGTELRTEFERWAAASFMLAATTSQTQRGYDDTLVLTYCPQFSRAHQEGKDKLVRARLSGLSPYPLGTLHFTNMITPNYARKDKEYCTQSQLRKVGLVLDEITARFEKPLDCTIASDEGPLAIFGMIYFSTLHDEKGQPYAPAHLLTYRSNDVESRKLLERLLA